MPAATVVFVPELVSAVGLPLVNITTAAAPPPAAAITVITTTINRIFLIDTLLKDRYYSRNYEREERTGADKILFWLNFSIFSK